MKPTYREEIKIVGYWECGISFHRHKTKTIAKKCIDRETNKPPPKERWTLEKYAVVVRLRDSGMTFKKIGQRFGIGGCRASSVYREALRHFKHEDDRIASETAWFARDNYFISSLRAIAKEVAHHR